HGGALSVSVHHLRARSPTHFLSFFTAPPPTFIYTLSLHDALPIYSSGEMDGPGARARSRAPAGTAQARVGRPADSAGRRRQDFLDGGHSLDWCNAERIAPRARPPEFPKDSLYASA